MKRILVVDDDKKFRLILSTILSDAGYDVTEAENGNTALEKARRDIPDLVLLDISMPDMNGFELMERLRAFPATKNLAVVMITATEQREGELTSWKLGARHYITKPFGSDEVLLTVRVALRDAKSVEDAGQSASSSIVHEPDTTIGTGSGPLNQILDGGIPIGSLTMIDGIPSSGKSILCQHLAHEALHSGHVVAYLSSDDTVDGLTTQMSSIGLYVDEFPGANRLRFYQMERPFDEECDFVEEGRYIGLLADLVKRLPDDAEIIIIDDITDLASSSCDRAVLGLFTACKRLCKDGRTIIVVANTYAFNDGLTPRLSDVCDNHMSLRFERVGQKSLTTLELTKLEGADLSKPGLFSFTVEPGLGIKSAPFGKIRV